MHFIDTWIALDLGDIARLLWPVALLVLATFAPGGRVARFVAIGLAIAMPFMKELGTPWPITAGWVALWLAVAWVVGRTDRELAPPPRAHAGGLESGTVGLLLGLSLLLLLGAAIARQDLEPEAGRRSSYAVLVLCLGLVHLMLRRHVRRAAFAFAVLGLGLQILDGAARAAEIPGVPATNGAALLASAIAVSLVAKLGFVRERFAGSPWVGDAHDLHD
jgi:hypothetical protein